MDELNQTTNFPNYTDVQVEVYAKQFSQNKFYLAMSMLMSGLMTFGLCGNCLVVIVVTKFPHMRSTTNLLLANLAINDLLTLLTLVPVILGVYLTGQYWLFGKLLCYALDIIYWTTACVSLFTLAIIATERYFAICDPLRVSVIFTRVRVICAIGIIWMLAVCISIPNIYIFDFFYDESTKLPRCNFIETKWYPDYTSGMDFVLLLPFVVIFVLYFFICKTLFHSIKSNNLHRSGDHLAKERKQVAKMIAIIGIVLLICMPPERIFHLLKRNGYTKGMDLITFGRLSMSFRALYIANSAVNPVIYSLMNSKFRDVFANIIFPGRQIKVSGTSADHLSLETATIEAQEQECIMHISQYAR